MTDPRSSRGAVGCSGLVLYNREILLDGQDILNDAPTSVYQLLTNGTPGASCTQSLAGGHRAAAVHAVRRVPLVALLPASPAVPARVQIAIMASSAEMGALASQQMFRVLHAS